VAVLRNGRLLQCDTPHAIYERPADLFVADFIGDANVLEAEVLPLDDARAEVRLGNVVLELPRRGLSSGKARIAARPEALVLSDTAPATPALQGVIRKAAYLGTHMEYTVTTPQGEVFIVDPHVGRPLGIGSDAWIGFTGAGVTLVPGSAA